MRNIVFALLYWISATIAQAGFANKLGVEVLALPFSYLFYAPAAVPLPGQKLPLVIYLHGGGERGSDLAVLRRHGPPLLIVEGKFPNTVESFYLVVPQTSLNTRTWSPADLNIFLTQLLQRYPTIDPARISVTGQSIGGIGTIAWMALSPERFQAGAPICGRGTEASAQALVNSPLWLFHGSLDDQIPVSASRDFLRWTREAGGTKIRYTELSGQGHMIHNEIYAQPALWQWLLNPKNEERAK